MQESAQPWKADSSLAQVPVTVAVRAAREQRVIEMNDFKSLQTRTGGDFSEKHFPAGCESQVIAGRKGMGGV